MTQTRCKPFAFRIRADFFTVDRAGECWLADWLSGVACALVVLWMASTLLSGSTFMPHVPQESQ